MRPAGPRLRLTCGVIVVLLLLAYPPRLRADSTNMPATTTPAESVEDLRAYLHLQAQLQATQLALERNRQEAETSAARHAELLQTRLRLLEQALVGERARELDALQDSQRLLLLFAGVFAGVGLLAVLLTNYIQWQAANRVVTMNSAHTLPTLASDAPLATLGAGVNALAPVGPTDASNVRWLGIIERLEARVRELEQTARPPVSAPAEPPFASPQSAEEAAANREAQAVARRAAQIDLLMGKGQALLDLGRAEEALSCFDETLRLDPRHTEALVKKGEALEQARKPDEAIACYDRAIAADRSLTVAYLHKGGLFNRLERHEEALQCYEAALKTQETAGGG